MDMRSLPAEDAADLPEAPGIRIAPMLATPSSSLPREPGFGYEFKWDGYRAVVHVSKGRARIDSRRLNDVTFQFPDVAAGATNVRQRHLILDGEIVALDASNRPSFGLLQRHLGFRGAGPRPKTASPIAYFVFDVLYRNGRPLLDKPYLERRDVLSRLGLEDAGWKVPPYETDQGEAMLRVSRDLGLEGVVAKRLDSPYTPGVRSRDWVKVKHRRRQEFVIGGWTRGEGGRSGTLGSLVLGHYDRRRSETRRGEPKPHLVYAGRVGTGFDDATLRLLLQELRGLETKKSPFQRGDPGPDVRFVRPRLVAEVSFTEWTHHGQLRQASFHGLRTDKDPTEVVREPIFKRNKEET